MPDQTIVGLAIEDRVTLKVRLNDDSGDDLYVFDEAILEGGDYFFNVHELISKALLGLIVSQNIKRLFGDDPGEAFNSISSLVVSVPGVVFNNRIVHQLPLWHSTWTRHVRWQCQGTSKADFDFSDEIANIADNLIRLAGNRWRPSEKERLMNNIFVVNDATACAAFEYIKRGGYAGVSDFVYVKLHNGVNVGVVERNSEGKVAVKHVQPEAGHSYPSIHELDAVAGFPGACHYHGCCFEGMVATNSFYMRAVGAKSGVFLKWKKKMALLETKGLTGQELDNELVRTLLESECVSHNENECVELLAHYVGQLVLQISIGPSAPKHIILGGRMAQPRVIQAIRDKVVNYACGYPGRESLSTGGIKEHVIASLASQKERHSVEVQGALEIAYSRAGIKSPSRFTLMKASK